MKRKITLAVFFLNLLCLGLIAQIPKVQNAENTGAAFPKPALPSFSELPSVAPLPDPFMWSNGSGRSTNFSDWERRRNEIKAEIENYEIGIKPNKPDTITATFTRGATAGSGTLRVFVTKNGQSLTLTSAVSFPATATGPFPAIIGMNSPSGSIPADVFTSRNIARITFSHNNVTTYGSPRNTDPFYRLYPDQNINNAGQYSAWAWGVSRLIDGLELVHDSLNIDLNHIGVTGCSYAGKMALFCGAFDERIALTIAQESGGGGAPAWRVSETLGGVEKLGNTDYNWFKEDMRQFAGPNVSKLPHDHHELMAMVAPRALLVTGNTDVQWLANPSCYVSARAAHEVWKTFGVGDRFGFYIDGGHGHCAMPATQRPAVAAFVDKFLLDKTDVNTDTVTVAPFPQVNYKRWYEWWGTGNPVLPVEPAGIQKWMEAECATVGSDWITVSDTAASGGSYVTVKSGLNSTSTAPASPGGVVVFPFTIDSAGTYNFIARINGPTPNDDSYYAKVDNGAYISLNGLTTVGWEWAILANDVNLNVGPHTFTIAYREDGALLDKILITTSYATITGKGMLGPNCGQAPVITPSQAFTINENALSNSAVGNVLATDPDVDTQFQNWKITGGTGAAAFAIDIVSGKLTVKDSSLIDYELAKSYTLTLTVTDGYHISAVETVTINLNNLDDNTPVIGGSQTFSISELANNRASAGNAAATDADDTNQPGFTTLRNWTITGGTGVDVFAIDANTGKIWVKEKRWLDFEYKTSYTLTLTVSDGTFTSAPVEATVNVVNVNDNNPIVTVNQRLNLTDYAFNGQVVLNSPIKVSDPDDANQPGFTTFSNFQVIGGSGAQAFAINAANGELTVKNANLLNASSTRIYSLSVRVSDGQRTGATNDIQIIVSTYVFVCHQGQSIYVQRPAAATHLRHGDTPGECAGTDEVTRNRAMAMGAGGESSLRVFPNPIKDRFTLVLGNNDLHINKVELIDITGRVMVQIPIEGRTGNLDIEIPRQQLTRGVYMLRMQGDKVVTQKVIIE